MFGWLWARKSRRKDVPLTARVLFVLQDGHTRTANELAKLTHAWPADINVPLQQLLIGKRIKMEIVGEYPENRIAYRIRRDE
jgi:hypothetical protein